jgi:hypothetical protein
MQELRDRYEGEQVAGLSGLAGGDSQGESPNELTSEGRPGVYPSELGWQGADPNELAEPEPSELPQRY